MVQVGVRTPQRVVRVAVVSGVAMLRSALAGVLAMEAHIEVVAEHGCDEDVFAAIGRSEPDVVVVDINAVCANCLSTVFSLRENMPHVRLLVMAGADCRVAVCRVVQAGVSGLMDRDVSAARVVDAVGRVADGEEWLDPSLASAAAEAADNPLTTREADVLRAAATGMSNTEIARELVLASGTVRNYLSSALTKTGTRTRIDAIRVATKAGWLLSTGRETRPHALPRARSGGRSLRTPSRR
jgi:two-component system response regulator DesR